MLFLTSSLVLYSIAFGAGVPLNGYVIFVASYRVERTFSTMLFLNRTVADFIFILFLPLRFTFLVILNVEWAKMLSSTVSTFHMFSSAFLLTALSIHRCIIVAYPAWAQNHCTPRLAVWVVSGVWALSLGLGLRYGDPWEFLPLPASISIHLQVDQEKASVAIQFLVGFLIPLALILIPTFYIILAAKMRSNRMTQSTKPLKILFCLILTFFICWFPYHIFSFLLIAPTYQLSSLNTGIIFASGLRYFNTCLSSIFYLTMEEEFLRYQQHAPNPETIDNTELALSRERNGHSNVA